MPKFGTTYIPSSDLRKWMELWTWKDGSGQTCEGPNPPEAYAASAERKAFTVKYVSKDGTRHGEPNGDRCVCIKVIPGGERLLKYTQSGEVRRVRDSLIYELNGYPVK